jgi:hypothetical protein
MKTTTAQSPKPGTIAKFQSWSTIGPQITSMKDELIALRAFKEAATYMLCGQPGTLNSIQQHADGLVASARKST